MSDKEINDLYRCYSVPVEDLSGHPDLKTPFRLVMDSLAMGEMMARVFVDDIKAAEEQGKMYRAIVPCNPKAW